MHTLWKGSISFGLVNVPIKMHAATETQEFHFNYLHEACHNRVRYIKKCPHCDVEVKPEEIVKGYEYEKERYVILEDEDLAAIEQPMSRSIDIFNFIDIKEVDPIYFQKSYYLTPEDTAQKAYRLLYQAMSDTGKIAIARFTMRSKQYLACLRSLKDGLVLETMYYPAEIRNLEVTWDKVTPTETEIAMARQLIDNLAVPFEPENYRDELHEQVREMIERKVAGESFKFTAAPEPGKVVDLMEALRASLAVTEQEKGKPLSTVEDEEKQKQAVNYVNAVNSAKEEPMTDEPIKEKSTLTPRRRRVSRAKGA
ncbi:Ku protein [Desulfitobacterium metallireducens]|uniref:Non-homologous end joining protein Ku n=1 Tax=Desulfitobacterium metallireducens DSM 15288 TaxID=871968 RepID=W0EDD0_9FIRM|nr:Ku protein [Desulfitobacterium metallireducens]AHF07543.1 DNA repair protein [Desulfitobacterium metallireducens DSM 15288]